MNSPISSLARVPLSRRAALRLGLAAAPGLVAATSLDNLLSTGRLVTPVAAQIEGSGAIGALYSAVWHPTPVQDRFVLGVRYEEFRNFYDSMYSADWRLQQISVHDQYGGRFYSAVFQPSGGDETQIYGVSYNEYRALYDALWPQGWRLKLLSVSRTGSYTAVWHRRSYDEVQLYGVPFDAFAAKYEELFPQGWRLALFQTFNPDSVRLFTAVWTRDTDPEVQLYTSPADSIRFKNIELGGQGFRLVGLTSVGFEPTDMAYSGVWRQPPPGTPPEPTVSLIGVDSQTFQDWYYQLVSNGFGVKLLHVEGLA